MSGKKLPRTKLWQVVPRQVFTPYDCLLTSAAFVVLSLIGCLWLSGVLLGVKFPKVALTEQIHYCFSISDHVD